MRQGNEKLHILDESTWHGIQVLEDALGLVNFIVLAGLHIQRCFGCF